MTPQQKWAMYTKDLALVDSTGHIKTKTKIALAKTFAKTADFLKVAESLHSKP